jgi:hypothetical protein
MSQLHIQGKKNEEAMNIKRLTAVGLTLFLTFILLVTPVLAGGPHFGKLNASGPDAAGSLTVSFKISGLGNSTWTPVSAHADVDAIYACKPANGDFPTNPIHEDISTFASPSGDFSVKKGSTEGVLIIQPPATSLTCEGMVVALAMVTYSSVILSTYIGQEGEWPVFKVKDIPGIFSATYYGYTP